MPEPTFIGIGPQKAGTTWLDAVLRRHGDICLPPDRKEVFFFDKYYNRGREWYESLFTGCDNCNAIGEITPTYFAKPHVMQRIAEDYPDIQLIIILRHPVDRLISHYGMFVENGSQAQDVMQGVEMHEALYRNSNYLAYLPELFKFFDRSQVHIMIYEELFADDQARRQHLYALGRFLDVDPDNLANCDVADKIRETRGPPKSRWLYMTASRLRKWLMRHDMERVIDFAKRLGLRREHLLQARSGARHKTVSARERDMLEKKLEPDIQLVERYLGRSIPVWEARGDANTNSQ